jgi:conjugative transfer signal peptidase TraF
MALGFAALAAAVIAPKRPILVWNSSASAPRGLYWLTSASALHASDWVLARLPEPARQMAAARGYLPAHIPLIKPIAALPNDQICAFGETVRLPSGLVLERQAYDSQGRSLPNWQGCQVLAADTVFLANPTVAGSFDSRYFGPVSRNDILGRLVPLWVR